MGVRVAVILMVGAVVLLVAFALLRRRASVDAGTAAPGSVVFDEGAAKALSRAGVPDAEKLAALAEPSWRITTRRVDSGSLPIGASRFGGVPDVPEGFEWPHYKGEPLVFLAQLDLSELAAPELPRTGWLLFFYDAVGQPWGFDPKDAGGWRVLHVDVPREALKRAEHPKVKDLNGPFELTALTFHRGTDLPDVFDSLLEARRLVVAQEHQDAYFKVAAKLAGAGETGTQYHHVLGHPQLIQNDMRGECQLVTHGVYLGDGNAYASARAKELLRTAADDWRLLLQIDSDEEPRWMWGDTGRLYFWIRKDDLAAGAFDKTWLALQCG